MNRRAKSIVFSFLSFVLPAMVVVLLIEGALRTWYFIHNRLEPPFAYVSKDIGWRPTANMSMVYQRKGYGEIAFSSNEQGFRRYANPQSQKTKVFAVGDSFTQAYHVSDGKAYFDVLAQSSTNIDVFAFGVGGYGTVQEAMVLREYSPVIRPDIVLWQFTGNDFINNDYLLESASSENSSHMRRPFLEDGKVVRRHPDGVLGAISEYSYLARRLLVIRGSFRKRSSGSIEDELNMQHADLRRSIQVTKQTIGSVVADYPEVTFFAFFAGGQHYPWELDAFAELCTVTSLHCLHEVNQAVEAAKKKNEIVDGGRDGHWNVTGHAIAGDVLQRSIQHRFDTFAKVLKKHRTK